MRAIIIVFATLLAGITASADSLPSLIHCSNPTGDAKTEVHVALQHDADGDFYHSNLTWLGQDLKEIGDRCFTSTCPGNHFIRCSNGDKKNRVEIYVWAETRTGVTHMMNYVVWKGRHPTIGHFATCDQQN